MGGRRNGVQGVSGRKNARKRSRETEPRSKPGGNISAAILQPRYAAIILIAGIVEAARVIAQSAARWNLDDFSLHYTSALALRTGADPYSSNLEPLGHPLGLVLGVLTRATDTPFFLVVFEPLTMLSPYTAYWVWFALSAIALTVTIMLLFREMPDLPLPVRIALIGLTLMYVPVAQNFLFSQSQTVILFLLTLAVIFMNRNRDEAAGAAIGLAVLMRGFPVFLIGYLAATRRWRAAAASLATIVAGGALTVAIAGVARPFSFIASAMPWITQPAFWGQWYNISAGAFIARLFYLCFGLALDTPGFTAARAAAIVTEFGLIGIAIANALRRQARSDPDFRVFSLWIATTIVVSPTAWVHYMTLFILPFFLLTDAALKNRTSERACWLAAANWALVAFAAWFYMRNRLGMIPVWRAPGAGIFPPMAEASFLAFVAGYAALYWFATDESPNMGDE